MESLKYIMQSKQRVKISNPRKPQKKKKKRERFLDALVVIAVCKSRGQNPKIAEDLESILEKNEKVKIIQLDARKCNMSKFDTCKRATQLIKNRFKYKYRKKIRLGLHRGIERCLGYSRAYLR